MGHDDLKVGGNLSVEGYAKVEHHLEVNGHLDFGQKTATCVNNAGVASATVNSASGAVTVTALPANTGDLNCAVTVVNSKVHADSIVLLTILTPITVGPVPLVAVLSVTEGSFVVGIASHATSSALTVNFLVC